MVNSQSGNKSRIYDLEERTARFGENVISFCKIVPKNPITTPLMVQFVKSGTSVGANYCEADCAESRRDFEHKLGICKKEAKESRHWARMIAKAEPSLENKLKEPYKEADELQLIFISIIKKSKQNGGQR